MYTLVHTPINELYVYHNKTSTRYRIYTKNMHKALYSVQHTYTHPLHYSHIPYSTPIYLPELGEGSAVEGPLDGQVVGQCVALQYL